MIGLMVRRMPSDEVRCTHIKVSTGNRCGQTRSEDGGDLCTWHKRYVAESVARRQLANDMQDIEPTDALRTLLKMSVAVCQRLELEILDADIPDWFSIIERETRTGGPGGDYELTRLSDVQRALVVSYRAERAELRNVTQLAIAHGLADRELKLYETQVEVLLQSMILFAAALGHDAESPDIREIMLTAMRQAHSESEMLMLERGV